MVKRFVIVFNLMFSLALASRGFIGMALKDPLHSEGYNFSTLMWIGGLVTLFLIPLEICVLKSPKREK